MAAHQSPLNPKEARAIARARCILDRVWRRDDAPAFHSPGAASTYLQCRLAALEREEFHACWLDAQHRLIAIEMLFIGTLSQTSVYPREVVRSALRHNAAAAIVAHNHPGGLAKPSAADIALTNALRDALALVDVKLLDHIIVAGATTESFAEEGLL